MAQTLVAARWLPEATHPNVRAAIVRGLLDIGICEIPPGSNRSGVINGYNLRAGGVVGDYWCASAVGAWWQDAGLEVPPWYGSCDSWWAWARATNRFVQKTMKPPVGAVALYGKPGDASHLDMVVRASPLILTVGGNTTVEGASYGASRNGVAVSLKELTASDPLLGYVAPFPHVG